VKRVIAALLMSTAIAAFAEEKKDAAPAAAKETPKDNISTTTHSIRVGGETVNYTARAGTIVMKDEDGAAKANFFFVAYTTPGAGDTRATIELMRDGKRLAQTPLELARPDDTGRIEQVSRLPLDALAPGRYELHVQVTQGGRSVVRSMPFRVES